jgi:pimeloyl-ACP methyl ester carboxylesterase
MAFSLGAALVATLMMRYMPVGGGEDDSDSQQHRLPLPPFKCAIFLSGGIPYDEDRLVQGHVENLATGSAGGKRLHLPTAHIWGSQDTLCPGTSAVLEQLCIGPARHRYIHDGGHEVPGSKSPDAVAQAVHVIRRTIDQAT